GLKLAPLQGLANQLTQLGLDVAHGFRQAKAGLQVAVVNTADFPGKGAPGVLLFAPGETGHAAWHGSFLTKLAVPGYAGKPITSRAGRLYCKPSARAVRVRLCRRPDGTTNTFSPSVQDTRHATPQ